MTEVHVRALNLTQRTAILSDGRSVPITDLFDGNGEQTHTWAKAKSFVCGEGGEWWSCPVADFIGRVH